MRATYCHVVTHDGVYREGIVLTRSKYQLCMYALVCMCQCSESRVGGTAARNVK